MQGYGGPIVALTKRNLNFRVRAAKARDWFAANTVHVEASGGTVTLCGSADPGRPGACG
jgi:hypothetical protein